MRRHLDLRLLALPVLLLVVAGCNDDPDVHSRSATYGLPDLEVDLGANEWVLDGEDSSIDVGDLTVTLDLHDDDTASGLAPCNAYRAEVDLDDDDESVRFTDIATTLQACDDATTAAEDDFLAALAAVRDVDLSDDRDELVLTGPDGVRLSFREFDAHEAIVGEWQVTGVRRGDAIESPPAGVEARVTFEEDRTIRVDTGCGTVEGDYELDDGELTVDDLTAGGCPGEDGEIEATLVDALHDAASIEVGPGGPILLTDDDTIAVVLTPTDD